MPLTPATFFVAGLSAGAAIAVMRQHFFRVVIWAALGPYFNYPENWQLVITQAPPSSRF